MKGKTQSILLQVAFKQAAARGLDTAATKLLTSQFYVLLQELHTEIGIDADDGAARGGGGGNWGGGAKKPAFVNPTDAVSFTLADGASWVDFRPSKTSGTVKAGFPDFKSSDGKESAYIYNQDGTPIPATVAILAAADGMATLAAPM